MCAGEVVFEVREAEHFDLFLLLLFLHFLDRNALRRDLRGGSYNFEG